MCLESLASSSGMGAKLPYTRAWTGSSSMFHAPVWVFFVAERICDYVDLLVISHPWFNYSATYSTQRST
jgi:hypothetical protein